jgi:hypothetical protein
VLPRVLQDPVLHQKFGAAISAALRDGAYILGAHQDGRFERQHGLQNDRRPQL